MIINHYLESPVFFLHTSSRAYCHIYPLHIQNESYKTLKEPLQFKGTIENNSLSSAPLFDLTFNIWEHLNTIFLVLFFAYYMMLMHLTYKMLIYYFLGGLLGTGLSINHSYYGTILFYILCYL